MSPLPRIPCPYCGELNVEGSNICGGCLRSIREVANPERADFEETVFAGKRPPRRTWWQRLLRKLQGRR